VDGTLSGVLSSIDIAADLPRSLLQTPTADSGRRPIVRVTPELAVAQPAHAQTRLG
jgi:hypothetical protein